MCVLTDDVSATQILSDFFLQGGMLAVDIYRQARLYGLELLVPQGTLLGRFHGNGNAGFPCSETVCPSVCFHGLVQATFPQSSHR